MRAGDVRFVPFIKTIHIIFLKNLIKNDLKISQFFAKIYLPRKENNV